ncbi:MAG: hypothetical protein M3Y72_04835 [Acidobacteriota bacterium]|nr:hypothetical protein [Acidobacteriota bacterium]
MLNQLVVNVIHSRFLGLARLTIIESHGEHNELVTKNVPLPGLKLGKGFNDVD